MPIIVKGLKDIEDTLKIVSRETRNGFRKQQRDALKPALKIARNELPIGPGRRDRKGGHLRRKHRISVTSRGARITVSRKQVPYAGLIYFVHHPELLETIARKSLPAVRRRFERLINERISNI